ncbi:acyltransferase [Pantoea sp. S61]|uniref:acyltransferase family protein n=1 Tax=Pantoea sp. S61 TaxID=2767442 RepID=UPI00190E0CB1|nr:acyltransferase [Pantoea sp. S61]MBK0123631.1 acyltransferase [Pantoea sp. S61]
MKKRALRILPAYYIILLISFLLGGAMSTFHYADKTENLISAFGFYPIYPEHPPFYVDDNGMYGIRWTLNYEVFFYLMVAISVLFKNRLTCLAILLSSTLIILPLSSGYELSLNPDGYRFNSAMLGLMSNPMIFLFVIGALIGFSYPHLKIIPKKLKVSLTIICMIMTTYLFSNGLCVSHGLLSSGWAYGLLLLSFVMAEEQISRYVPNVMVELGNISFSLYLIHTLMNNGIGKRFSDFGVPDGYLRFTISIILSCLLAWFSYQYIERPISLRNKISTRVHS